jgi:hypothetical protein
MDLKKLRLWVHARWMLTRGCGLAIGWVMFCAPSNFQFAQPFHDGTLSPALICSFFGFLCGQVAWVSIWSVLAPWNLSHRLVFCVIATMGLWASTTAPLWMPSSVLEWLGHPAQAELWPKAQMWPRPSLWPPVGLWPLSILALQSPLWVARTWFGWRIVQPMSQHPSGDLQPLSIRDLLLATACLGAALGYFRFSIPQRDLRDLARVIVGIVVGGGSLAVASLLFALPAVAVIMREKRGYIAVILIAGVQAAIIALSFSVLCLVSGVPPTRAVVAITSTAVLAFVTLDLPLFLAHGVGYRLQWRRWATRTA